MPSKKKPEGPNPALAKTDAIAELPLACSCEAEAVAYLERKRWGATPCCAKCGSVDVYKMAQKNGTRSKKFMWRCRDCNAQYSVRTGTSYAESLIPLHKWLRAMWEASVCKNGVSSMELSRKLQVSYKSALFLSHRINHAKSERPTSPNKLRGTVEADETYVGPRRPRYTGTVENPINKRGRGTKKQPVLAVLERGGKVRTQVVANVTGASVREFLNKNVCFSSRLMTDSEGSYFRIGPEFKGGHHTVNHKRREYVRGDVTTNGIEGFFARVKRGLYGTYHAVSKEHLHRYMDQFAFAHNTRGMNDGERTEALIDATIGKRLMYEDYVVRDAG